MMRGFRQGLSIRSIPVNNMVTLTSVSNVSKFYRSATSSSVVSSSIAPTVSTSIAPTSRSFTSTIRYSPHVRVEAPIVKIPIQTSYIDLRKSIKISYIQPTLHSFVIARKFSSDHGAAQANPTPPSRTETIIQPNDVPLEKDSAVGREYEEIVAKEQGIERFDREPLTGSFGTMDEPVIVLSGYESRIVGCLGGDGKYSHDLQWFELFAGRKHACTTCGQIFQLKQITSDEAEAASVAEDDHDHDPANANSKSKQTEH